MITLAEIDLELLSPRARWTYTHIAEPKADLDLTDDELADRLELPKRQVQGLLDELAQEISARLHGGVLPDLNQDDYEALRESIRQVGQLEPIVLGPAGEVIDGRHRMRACEELGIEPKTVQLEELAASPHELTLAANMARRQLKREQMRAIVESELIRDPQRSDRAVAATLGVSPSTVGAARRSLVTRGEVPKMDTSVGRDGKAYPRPSGTQEPVDEVAPHRIYVDATEWDVITDIVLLSRRYYDAHRDEYVDEELADAYALLDELRDGRPSS